MRVTLSLLVIAASLTAQQPPTPPPDPAPQEEGYQGTTVITPTRQEAHPDELPVRVARVDEQDLQVGRLLQDALQELPGVMVQRTSIAQSSPFIRGFTGYHTLLMLDGVRLNNSIIRSGPNEYWGTIDPLSLDGVELLNGPASQLYGSDAVGGVLNARSKRREDYGPGFTWDRRTLLRFSTANHGLLGRAEVSGQYDGEVGFVVGGSVGSFDDLDQGGGGEQPGTGYSQWFADAAIDVFLDENWSLSLTARTGRLDDVRRTHRTVDGVNFAGTTNGSELKRDHDFDRDIVIVGMDGTDLEGFISGARIRLAWLGLEETRERVRSDMRRDRYALDVDTLGITVELTSDLERGRLTYGFDWYHDEVDSWRKNYDAMGAFSGFSIQGPVGDDSSYDLAGLFAQYELPVTEDFDVVAGGRFTYAAIDVGRMEDPATGNAIGYDDEWYDASFSVRGIYRLSPEVSLWAGASQAFRAPNLSDVSRLDTARSNEIEVPTLGLDPEDFLTFEIGTHVRWEGLSVDANYFYTLVDDLIIRQPTNMMIGMDTVVTKRNGGEGHVQGIELSGDYEFVPGWSVFASGHWIDGQQEVYPTSAPDLMTEPIDRHPPLSGLAGVGWHTEDETIWARAFVHLNDRADRLGTRDQSDSQRIPENGTPGWTTFNVEGGYRFDDNKSVFVAVENITDRNYRIHGSGVQEPGFNLTIGADIGF